MKLLYIADDGFSYHSGKYYYTRPNYINTKQFGKYFEKIIYLARECDYIEGSIEISNDTKVFLVKKMDFFGLINILKEHVKEYDVALLRNGMNGCISVNTLKKIGKPIISYLGYDALSYKFSQRSIIGYIEGVFWYCLEKNKMAKGDYAHYCADYLVRRYPSKVQYLVCPNVEIEVEDENLEFKKKKYTTVSDKCVVGMIATLNFNKGIDTAIKAMAMLPKDFVLEIIGSGNKSYYESLAQKHNVNDRVRFLGYYADKNKLKSWLKDIDVYIQPSLSEGLPRAAIEAMAMACPLIVSNTIGVSSWIEKQWQIKPRDYCSLAEKIKQIGNDVEALLQQSLNNFEKSKIFQKEVREEKMDSYYKLFLNNVGKEK